MGRNYSRKSHGKDFAKQKICVNLIMNYVASKVSLRQRGRLVPRWSAPQRLTLTLGMLRSLRGTRTAGVRCSMNMPLVTICRVSGLT